MSTKKQTYSLLQKASCVFMALSLVWMTISLPFMSAAKKKIADLIAQQGDISSPVEDDNTFNPFGNTTEEKASSSTSNNFSEEYHLDDNHELFHILELINSRHPHHIASEYTAFHGEMLCPPPNVC